MRLAELSSPRPKDSRIKPASLRCGKSSGKISKVRVPTTLTAPNKSHRPPLSHPDPDFLYVAPSMTACAAFSKESRMRFANVTCGAPFSQTKAPAREPAALALWLFIPYFGYFSMQWLTTDWLGPNNQAVRQDVRAHVQGPLFGRRAHSRSLGFAPTARRGRRDEKGGGR